MIKAEGSLNVTRGRGLGADSPPKSASVSNYVLTAAQAPSLGFGVRQFEGNNRRDLLLGHDTRCSVGLGLRVAKRNRRRSDSTIEADDCSVVWM